MRPPIDLARLNRFMESMGRRTKGHGRIYLTGGATALLHGWREMTIDIDLKADPEPDGFFEAIALIKDQLAVNVELASPADFIPELPDWRERSPLIAVHGSLSFHHYDPYSQALSKLERGHSRDLTDAHAMVHIGLIAKPRLLDLFDTIEPHLIRYPAIEPGSFRQAVESFCSSISEDHPR